MYHGVKADSVPPFTRTPYGAHYCLGAFCSITQDSFFAPPRESQSFQPRSRLTLLARASDLDERKAAQFPMCLRSCLRGRKSGARLLASRMDAVCVKSEDTGRPGGHCHEIGHPTQGLSEEESRELDVARRGLASQRGAGRSVALSQIEYNMG